MGAVLAGSLPRIDAVSRLYPPERDQRSDVRRYYMSAAESALAGRGFIPSYPTNFIPPPGQTFFLYLLKGLWPTSDYQQLRAVQAVVSILSIPLAAAVAAQLGGPWAAVLCAWLVALQQRLAELVGTLLPETNYVFCFFAFAGLLLWALRRGGLGAAAAAGGLLGIACLLKPTPTLLAPVCAALIALERRRHAGTREAAGFLLGFALLVTPWIARNAVRYGHLYPISTNGGTLLALSNAAELDPAQPDMVFWDDLYQRDYWKDPEIESRFADVRDLDGKPEENLKDRAYFHKALSYMASRPGHFLRNYALKAVNFVRFPGAEPPGADAPPVPFREPYGLTGLVTAAGLLGCVLLPVLRRRDAAVRATVLLVLYLLASGALLHISRDGRMNLLFRAFLAVPAAALLAYPIGLTGRRARAASPSDESGEPRTPVSSSA